MAEPNWRPLLWKQPLVYASIFGALLLIATLVLSPGRWLVSESGPIEVAQVACWVLSAGFAVVVARRVTSHTARWSTILLGVLAVLALLRELDMHELLNPDVIGPWGVHYRIDWWLDPAEPLGVKALWVGVLVLGTLIVAYPAWRARGKPDCRRARPRLVVAAVLCLAGGLVIDDLLREVFATIPSQIVEESLEFLGCVFFLAAVVAPESAAVTAEPIETPKAEAQPQTHE